MRAQEDFIPWGELEHKLKAIEIALRKSDISAIRLILRQMVAGFVPSDEILDWVYLERAAGLD
jgi:hypothetical protein